MSRSRPLTPQECLARYPRLCAHITAESLGYAVPQAAAYVLSDAKGGGECDCEWVRARHAGRADAAVRAAVRNRHAHAGYRYDLARHVTQREREALTRSTMATWL